jgi:hypothetical protein
MLENRRPVVAAAPLRFAAFQWRGYTCGLPLGSVEPTAHPG